MKILHTADWHVGKVLKGRPRVDEHREVLRELVAAARTHDVDAVIVAGDLFDTSAPTPEAQSLVLNALMALRGDGRDVVVLAGNHDNPQLLEVYRPVLGKLGLHVLGSFRRPDQGGTLAFTARSGEPVRLGVLPFLSHRYVVRAAEVLGGTAAEHNRDYAARIGELIGALTAGFHNDTVNLVTTHGTLPGGAFGGGEREAQSIFSYYFEPTVFPPATQYAALGHLHRRQQIPGPCPIWYSGSPLAVDFGEEGNTPGALLVEVSPGRPAVVRELTFASARRLRTVRGTLEELEGIEPGDDWLKVIVEEKPRVGLADDVRELLSGAVDVRLDERFRPVPATRRADSAGRSPRELFRDYLAATGREDEQVAGLFDRLYDEVSG
ncbi:exonuclease SbcCD subunit D [Nonomuraea roseoviolacea subsp. roseoviolacea]|uniref:Nuclease SbcCD subunit D n=1 Tax=Nonomuraea roseoviolacea subsp. carminata TaxID=160689 RepID=A0ABT1KG09_9ACTN|nr:exonuclease SbcCD subunit D [Nonomuraea roseoviolacea]MCP2352885.1 exonuclease SbcD [Nonomuraea roseoviolacea subsp. carminata]